MAIAIGTNNLNPIRRHLAGCTRFPKGSKQPLTHKPGHEQSRFVPVPDLVFGIPCEGDRDQERQAPSEACFRFAWHNRVDPRRGRNRQPHKLGALPAIAPSTNRSESTKPP